MFKVFTFFSDINEESLAVFAVHKYPQFKKQCCNLVNEEWPRSETARMLSINASCDKMPTCLILVQDNKEVIGHCKLTPIPSIKESCFVESVVISKKLRGQKLGTFLMQACEEYCKSVLNLKFIHLSTKGQENFYRKLGYAECEPISIYGGFFSNKIFSNFKSKDDTPTQTFSKKEDSNGITPLLKNSETLKQLNISKNTKTYMMKSLDPCN